MRQEIKASFKQATIKAGTATLQFEVLPSAEGFTQVMKLTGGVVLLTLETEQDELPFEEQPAAQPVVNICNVNADTGEVTEDVLDCYALPEGGEQ